MIHFASLLPPHNISRLIQFHYCMHNKKINPYKLLIYTDFSFDICGA